MYLTERNKSNELIYLEALAKRATLTAQEEKTLKRLRRGHEGEKLYDTIFDEVGHENLNIFRDIWLKADKSLTQIDTLIITDDILFINEIKNYSGHYKYEGNMWKIGKLQISDDPLIQAKRSVSKLVKLFIENKINITTDYNVICPDPYFILTTQDDLCRTKVIKRDVMKQYFRGLNQHQSWDRSARITEIIKNKIVSEPAYEATIDPERLTLGRQCSKCCSFSFKSHRYFTLCTDCSHKDSNKNHIHSAIKDFHILFPGEKIKIRAVRNFLNNEISDSTIKRYMGEFCLLNNKGRYATYTLRPNHNC